MLLVVNNGLNHAELQRHSDECIGSRHKALLVLRLGNGLRDQNRLHVK